MGFSVFTKRQIFAQLRGVNRDAPNPLQGFNLVSPILESYAKFLKENGPSVIAPRGKEEKASRHWCGWEQ